MNTKINIPQWESVSPSQWQTLSQKKIFFAHMSVGSNILEGVHAVLQKHPDVLIKLVKTSDPNGMSMPALYHVELGYNAKPVIKIDSFCSLLNRIGSAGPDIVLMKFCYVDIFHNTDVDILFTAYQKAINEQEGRMPGTRFLHCTIPLKSSPTSIKIKCKETIKAVLGRANYIDANAKREKFNEMLRNTWPAEQILDIAQIESTTPEGFLCYKSRKGQSVPFLCPNYTSDGGHLNQLGAQRVGQQFLIFLANAATLSEPKNNDR